MLICPGLGVKEIPVLLILAIVEGEPVLELKSNVPVSAAALAEPTHIFEKVNGWRATQDSQCCSTSQQHRHHSH